MISKKEVKHIAGLGRLQLTEKEVIKMQKELSVILDYFNLLKELDPSSSAEGEGSITPSPLAEGEGLAKEGGKDLFPLGREDLVQKQPSGFVDKLVEASPETEKRFVKVKAIIMSEGAPHQFYDC